MIIYFRKICLWQFFSSNF